MTAGDRTLAYSTIIPVAIEQPLSRRQDKEEEEELAQQFE